MEETKVIKPSEEVDRNKQSGENKKSQSVGNTRALVENSRKLREQITAGVCW